MSTIKAFIISVLVGTVFGVVVRIVVDWINKED